MFRKNTAGQFIHFQGVDASTGGILTGATYTARRCIDGTFAAATGTVTEDTGVGFYKFAMSQADTNGNNIGFNFTATGAVPQTVNIVTTACDPTSTAFGLSLAKTTNITGFNDIAATAIVSAGAITTLSGAVVNVDLVDTLTTYTGNTVQTGDSFARIGAAGVGLTAVALADATSDAVIADAVWNAATVTYGAAGSYGLLVETDLDAAISSRLATAGYTAPDNTSIAAILVDTAEIGVAGAGLTAINLPDQTMSITGNITGNLSGSVGSVTGAVGSVTGLTASDVGAIKTQTDKFVFTVANQVDANVQYINDTAVTGDGSVTPWGPV